MAGVTKAVMVLACVTVVPTATLAQAIAGSVADASGSMLAAVLVEARSAVLIEKPRTAVSDERGRYRIDGLRPGTYTVTFVHPGFRIYFQEGIEVTVSFAAVVDAALMPGSLTESVVVTGTVALPDIHDANRVTTLGGDLVRSIPVVRSYNAVVVLVPGVVTSVSDTVTSTATIAFPIHGGRATEGRLQIDGFNIGSPPSGNSATSYAVNVGNADHLSFHTGGALGEVETAGLVMNIVPKTGSNALHGTIFGSGTSARLQADNLTPALRELGVRATALLSRVYDFSGALGGPIVKDRAWYFIDAHTGGSTRGSADVYYNRNAGDPAQWRYTPDFGRRAYSDRTFENASARLTWLASPRNTVGGFWDAQTLCRTCTGATAGLQEPARVAPEAVGVLGGNAASASVNLVAPGTMFGDRINQLDVRIGKILSYGRTRTMVAVDIYNSLNRSASLAYNTAFIPRDTWPQPIAVQTPRFVQLTAEFDV